MDLAEYCRDLEAHLCRKNDGHLIRIVGPSFDMVSRWAAQGIPLKVAMGGIDRYFERYYRKGPRRRPVRIDFCEADVLDLFDEWRRATGVSPKAGDDAAHEAEGAATRKRGPSLREHLERVLTRLSSLRATGVLDASADLLIDRVSTELDRARGRAAVRGEARAAAIARLQQMDDELLAIAMPSTAGAALADARRDAIDELSPFRTSMAAEAYERALERATVTALRERLQLPVIAFS